MAGEAIGGALLDGRRIGDCVDSRFGMSPLPRSPFAKLGTNGMGRKKTSLQANF
jgi:hypothetical protein